LRGNPPKFNGRSRCAALTFHPHDAALSARSLPSTRTAHCQQTPIGSWTHTWHILQCDEGGAIQHDNIAALIGLIGEILTAGGDPPAGAGKTPPVRCSQFFPRVGERLIGAASKSDDTALVRAALFPALAGGNFGRRRR